VSVYLRLGITGALIVLWFVTQKALSKRGFPAEGIHDKVHFWTRKLHKYLLDNPQISRLFLITSSIGIDILGIWLCVDSIFGASFQPMIGLFILFSLRQLSQYLSALPAPDGMIWFHPGVPSIFVTYGVSNDLFFSGHTALAVFGGIHLLGYDNIFIQVLALFLIFYEVSVVLILRAHWTLDVFTGIVTALWVSSVSKVLTPMLEEAIRGILRIFIYVIPILMLVGGANRAFALAEAVNHLPAEVKVGVVAYDDLKPRISYFKSLSQDLIKLKDGPFHVRFAFGSYEEVSRWTEEGLLDIAIISPGVYVDLENKGIISVKENSLYELLARENSGQDKIKCFAKVNSDFSDLRTIKTLNDAGKFTLLAPDSLSATGFMLPWEMLDKSGVHVLPQNVQFTHSHTNALKFLVSSTNTAQMACVWSGSINAENLSGLRQIDLPGLDQIALPDNALISRRKFLLGKSFINALLKIRPQHFRKEGLLGEADNVLRQIRGHTAEDYSLKAHATVPMDDIIFSLLQYTTTQPEPPRLAVVLSGGGAKCSYQLGAVRAIEEKLTSARTIPGLENLDINLVVGTSGGAVNALPVALGLTKTEEGYKSVRQAWNDMDQRELIRPSLKVRFNMGLWFAVGQLLIFISFRQFFLVGVPKKMGIFIMGIGLFEMLAGYWPYKPWHLLGQSSNLHHIWLWLSFGVTFAGGILFLLGFLIMCSSKVRLVICSSGWFRRSLILLTVILPLIQAWVILVHENTLTDGKGLEAVLKRNYARILKDNLNVNAAGDSLEKAGIRELSEILVNTGKRSRDLVLTASPLAAPGSEIMPDLYFFLPSEITSKLPNYAERGVSLAKRPGDLFSVLLGSSAIYPIFPARVIKNFPVEGKKVELVDGSFAHRSPLEAAVMWGATHVIVIEASPIEPPVPSGFAGNLATALNLLYDQAQLTDQRAHGITPVFTLFPNSPQIGLLDFADNLIDLTVDKGYREALGNGTSGGFIKEFGSPLWWDPLY
jgi:predicted acylesterase/phospholipase RssA/ABC-type phosphate/phosphonate transport system substrate-binding protein